MSTTRIHDSTDSTGSVLTHLSGILLGWLVPLVVYLLKKDDGETPLVRNAREALNWQITVFLGCVVSGFLTLALVGFIGFLALGLANSVFCVLAAIKAGNGQVARYPLTIRLIR